MVYKPLWGLLKPVRRCPWCGGRNIQPSTHPVRLLRLLRCETWRCHQCWRRFPHRPGPASPDERVSQATPRRRPAGKELLPLDAALAGLLSPGALDEGQALKPQDGAPSDPPRRRDAPRPRADDRA